MDVDDDECLHGGLESEFEVDALLEKSVVSFLVEAVEAGGAVGYVLLNLVGLFEDSQFLQFLAKVPLVEFLLEDCFVEALQFGEGELLGKEFEADRLVTKLSSQAVEGGVEDLFMIEGKARNFIEGEPSGIARISVRLGRMVEKVDESIVGNGDDVLAGIALRIAEGVSQFPGLAGRDGSGDLRSS